MDLFFLRHGSAGDAQTWQGPDEQRPLTAEGRTEMEAVAALLMTRGLELDAIISSPLARARQTAEIMAAHAGLPVEESDLLAPGFDTRLLGNLLRQYPDKRRVMIVGHEPGFSGTISAITGGSTVVLKKAGLARVRLPDGRGDGGSLLWLASPGLLLGRD